MDPRSRSQSELRQRGRLMSRTVTNCHEFMSHRDNAAVSVIKSVHTTVTRAMQSVLMRSALSAFNRSLLEITIVMKVKLLGDDSPWASRDVILSVRRATWKKVGVICEKLSFYLGFGGGEQRSQNSQAPPVLTSQSAPPVSVCQLSRQIQKQS